MRKLILKVIVLLVSILCFACAPEEVIISVASVVLNTTSLTLEEGETFQLEATVNPYDAKDKTVAWTSDNGSVASVSNGLVKARRPGQATIIVTTSDGGKTARCNVTVIKKMVNVSEVSLNHASVELTEGDNVQLTATVFPAEADNKDVIWSSSDISVAEVNKEGMVTALSPGTATITVTTEDGGLTADCDITVIERIYPVESVSLNNTSVELIEGDDIQLTATVYPENATNKDVTWSSSDASIANVENGLVTALSPGTATITVTTKDGDLTADCDITVIERTYPVESVSLNHTSVELIEGDDIQLTATVYPENATNKNVIWSSSNTSIAKVSDGFVTTFKPGTVTITVKTEDGDKTAKCKIIVKERTCPVESVSLNHTSVELIEGDDVQLTATVYPENATNKNVIWSSSNTSVAKVNSGFVTTFKPGTVTITVKTEDGDKIAKCKIIVKERTYSVESVSLNLESLQLAINEMVQLTATVYPENATNKDVIWSSSNPSVAKVSNNGWVTALKPGETTVKVKTKDGEKTAQCKVIVVIREYEGDGNGERLDEEDGEW